MPEHVTVYPTKKSAVGLAHPGAHPLTITGTLWPRDSFTGRRLTDGSVTTDADKAFKPDPIAKADEKPAAPEPAPTSPKPEPAPTPAAPDPAPTPEPAAAPTVTQPPHAEPVAAEPDDEPHAA